MNAASPKRRLTLLDSTCIIVGIIIGAGIYESTPGIAANVGGAQLQAFLVNVGLHPDFAAGIAAQIGGAGVLLAAFALGGLISFIGALCYAELAIAYPREGGEYVFLTRAYGRRTGFLFAWSEFWIVRPGSIGAMAYVFASYAAELLSLTGVQANSMLLALGSVLVITGVNVFGVQTGKWTQNVLTTAKVVGLLGVFAVGACVALGHPPDPLPIEPAGGGGFRLAMILVLFVYGGWNEISYVAAEVRDPQRNILRALILGTAAVTAIYLLVNLAFIGALGFQGVRDSRALASDVLRIPCGAPGAAAISLLICISALGAINGMVFTGARVYYALGLEHRFYAWLGHWHPRLETPLRALVIQSVVAMAMIAVFDLYRNPGESFQELVAFTAPFFWYFFTFVAVSLFVLRYQDGKTPRPFRVPLYPLMPILFCASTLFMLHAAVTYAMTRPIGERAWYAHFVSLWPVGIMLLGLLASLFDPPLVADGEGRGTRDEG